MKLSFDEHVLDWDEGNDGLGIIDSLGNVHTWNADDAPLHKYWLDSHPNLQEYRRFYIEADGLVLETGTELEEQDQDLISEADPRLHFPQSEHWHF